MLEELVVLLDLKRVAQGDLRQLLDDLGGTGSTLVLSGADLVLRVEGVGLLKVCGYVDEGSYLGNFREEVGAEVHDLLQQEPALDVELRVLVRVDAHIDQGFVDAAVVECLQEEGHVVVQQVLALSWRSGGRTEVVVPADVERHVEYLDEQVQDGQLLVQLDRLVEGADQRSQSQWRGSNVDQALLCSDHVHDCLGHEVQLQLQLLEDLPSWLFFDTVGLSEDAEDAVEVFEVTKVHACGRVVDQDEEGVNDQVLSYDALLS